MILTGWHVEGFGILADYRVEGLQPGLTVVFGLNEAGKTTLLDFIRFALFGRERGWPAREPLRGGRHGGRLFLLDEAGRTWVVERFVSPRRAVLVAPDGREAGEAELSRLRGGADARLFRAVFAFGLGELSQFESLSEEQVRDQIFSAGITGAGALATRARQLLEAEAQRLLKPRAGARINELLEELRRAREELRQAQEAAARYPQLREEEARAHAEAEQLERRWQELQAECQFYRTLLELWPLWVDYREAEEAVRGLPPPLPAELEREVLALAEEARLQRRRLEDLRAAEVRVEETRAQLAMLLAELGPGFTRERVRDFALPIPVAEELEGWQRLLQEAEREAADAARAEAEAERQREEAAARRRQREEEFSRLAGAPTLREVAQRQDLLAAVERRLALLRVLEGRMLVAGTVAGALAVLGVAGLVGGWTWPGGLLLGAGLAAGAAVLLGLERPRRLEARAVRELASQAGLPARPGPAALEQAWMRLRQEEERARERQQAEERLREALDAERRAGEQRDRLAGEAERARRRLAEVEARWLEWRRARGLPEGLMPAGAGRFAVQLRAAKQKEADLRLAEAARDRLEGEVGAWRGRARAALAAAGEGVPADDAGLVAAVEALAEAVRQARDARQRLQERRRALAPRLTAGEAAGRLRERLEQGDRDAWEAALAELEREAERVRSERDRAIERRRDAERARRELEASADIPAAAGRVHAIEAELEAAVTEWRVRRLALLLLDRTLEAYVRDRQPEVLRVASRVFAHVTGGRYTRVIQETDGQTPVVAVLDRDGRRLLPQQLSRGTAEQLYLALRLGLADSFSRRAAALPLVMDDVLVNFDPLRAERILQAMAEYLAGSSRQVLLFTCHPETVRLAQRVCRPCRVLELAAPGPAVAEAAAGSSP